jgi:UTP-glucose-1-phosphate uridylyltransferase
VLTPDVFEEIAAGRIGALGEIQLTDALRAQAARSPFHGVISHVDRFDTGTPFGFLTAAIELGRATRPGATTCARSSPSCPPAPAEAVSRGGGTAPAGR